MLQMEHRHRSTGPACKIMHGAALKAEERCILQPQTLEKPETISKWSCPDSEGGGQGGGVGDENNRRPSVHYESLPLEGREAQTSKAASNAVTGTIPNPPLSNTVSCNRNVLLKSFSLPNPENAVFDLPDPFPELSRERLSTVSAGIYGGPESSASLPNSPGKTAQLTAAAAAGIISAACTPGATSSCASTDCDINNSSSAESKMTVPIFVNAQKSYSVEIEDRTNVSDVCDHLDRLTDSKRDPFWTIVEQVDKFNLERSLDDHELLIPILKSWNSAKNRLVYRRDCCRYELYSNPNHCFPEQMLDVKLPKESSTSFMTRNELYRNLLLKCLLANESMPDIQSYLHIRDGKKSWKRYFCVLRNSGLFYVTKGCVKESRHMVLLSDLKSDNIYTALNSKKVFGVPTQHGFCLAPSHDLSDKHKLRQFCADDEQSRHCWITGMRFVKFGDQLLENWRRFASCHSGWKENTAASERAKGCNSKICDEVVMSPVTIKIPSQDFRGNFQSSGQTWLRSRLTKSVSSVLDSSSSAGEAQTSVHHSQTSSSNNNNHRPPCLNNLEWFHPLIGRNEAISLLCNDGLREGSFLVRHSQTLCGVYVLSFVHSGTVKHCTIHKTRLGDGWYYSLDGGSTKFVDLAQLIDFYRLNAGRLPTRLSSAASRAHIALNTDD